MTTAFQENLRQITNIMTDKSKLAYIITVTPAQAHTLYMRATSDVQCAPLLYHVSNGITACTMCISHADMSVLRAAIAKDNKATCDKGNIVPPHMVDIDSMLCLAHQTINTI